MKDRGGPGSLAYLGAENAYAEARTAVLAPLRTVLFEEIRSRVQESDLSVPIGTGRGGITPGPSRGTVSGSRTPAAPEGERRPEIDG